MKLENLFEYIVPIAVLVLYFVLNARKKKKEEPQIHQEGEPEPPAPARRTPPLPTSAPSASGLPSVSRKLEDLHSLIEDRKLDSAIEERSFSSAITEARASGLISSEMLKHIDLDPAYAQNKKGRISHAKGLLKSRSLRDVFLLKEILNRPYE